LRVLDLRRLSEIDHVGEWFQEAVVVCLLLKAQVVIVPRVLEEYLMVTRPEAVLSASSDVLPDAVLVFDFWATVGGVARDIVVMDLVDRVTTLTSPVLGVALNATLEATEDRAGEQMKVGHSADYFEERRRKKMMSILMREEKRRKRGWDGTINCRSALLAACKID
jgi:hypothetical protein